MASVFKGTGATDGVFARVGLGITTIIKDYSVLAALVINDVIEMIKVPKGARIIDGWLSASDLDTGTPAITLHVGDGGVTSRFITSSVAGQAGTLTRFTNVGGFGYIYPANDTIDVLVAVAPATGVAGTITVCVSYTIDP